MIRMIIKSSGKEEPFNKKKFSESLKRAGAPPKLIRKLTDEVEKRIDLKTTHDIYKFALDELKKERPPIAASYNLKQALMDFGPTGFPFEQFVADLLKEEGYKTLTDKIVYGFCVFHEIDVIAQKENQYFMIECKFHNHAGLKTDVIVSLYVQARFKDILKQQKKSNLKEFQYAWLATNTQFTSEAIAYAECMDMKLLGWGYPKDNNIAQKIKTLHMYPITCLTTLSMRQKKILIGKDLVLCKDVSNHIQHLKDLGLSDERIQQVVDESEGLCAL
jgi:Holliday junction resolvase-like predicted endonuclease